MDDEQVEAAGGLSRRQVIVGLACGGAIVGVGVSAALRSLFPYFAISPAFRAARARAKPRIERADAESRTAIDSGLAVVEEFFAAAQEGTEAFADDVLGWYSKYSLIRGRHEEFLAESFRGHFFGPEELTEAMRKAVAAYVDELDAIDGRMLADIRMDVAGLPLPSPLARLPAPDVQGRYREICGRISGLTDTSLKGDVVRVVSDVIVESVVAMVAARMAASATAVGGGAASGWWTLGIGLVVGVIADQIIAAAWDWAYDPRGKLVEMMRGKIDEVRRLVIEGEDGRPGLRRELERYADRRAVARRDAVLALLTPVDGEA